MADMLTVSSVGQNSLYNKLHLILAHEDIFTVKFISFEECYKISSTKEKSDHQKCYKCFHFALSSVRMCKWFII